jgi:hypothetical protein
MPQFRNTMPVIIKENIIPKYGKRAAYVQIYPIVNPDKSIAFLPTLKAGSSTMSTILERDNGWVKMKPPIPEKCQLFGLVRYPYDRWISGTAEHWDPIVTINGNNSEPLINTSFEQLLSASLEDRHTQPQAWNFDRYSDIKLFKLETIYKVWKWLNMKDPKKHIRNHETQGGMRKEVWDIIAEKAIKKDIEEFYSEDMQLWNKAI